MGGSPSLDAVAVVLGVVVFLTFATMGFVSWWTTRSARRDLDLSYLASLAALDRLAPPRLPVVTKEEPMPPFTTTP